MPPRFDPGDQLSPQHLPDTSDTSFSFQIPTVLSKGDLLLADDDVDFLQNVDDSMTSLEPSKINNMPLTLAELTPQAKDDNPPGVDIGGPTSDVLDQQCDLQPKKIPLGIGKVAHGRLPRARADLTNTKATRVRSGEASPAVSRLRALRSEVEMLNEDLQGGMDDVTPPQVVADEARERHEGSRLPKAIPKRKHTVISGGITKKSRSKNIPLKSSFARGLVSISAPQSEQQQLLEPMRVRVCVPPQIAGCEEQNPDDSMCSTTSGHDAVVARLVTYGQKFMNSFGVYPADNASAPEEIDPETTRNLSTVPEFTVVDSTTRNPDDAPLTISQLSPRHQVSPIPSSLAATAPTSPRRPSNKRPASVASSSRLTSKKSKSMMVTTSKPNTGPPISKDAKLPSGISSNSLRSTSSSTRAHATLTKKKNESLIRKPPPAATTTTAAPQDASSEALDKNCISASRSCNSGPTSVRHSRAELNVLGKHSVTRAAVEASSGASSSLGDNGPRHENTRDVTITKPVEFTFQLDMRMEARKAEYVSDRDRSLSRRKERTQLAPVPDFKSLHTHHEVEIAHRKENIHPTIPLPFEFHTDERAKERERFDRMIRDKERELERVMEQRRREREENEEREVRELRKKAVPKAHQVPEWYNEAPKKKNRA